MVETFNKQEGPRAADKSAKQETEAHKPHEPQKMAHVEEEKKLATEQKAEKKGEEHKTEEKKKAAAPAKKEEKKEEKKREVVLERLYTVNLQPAYATTMFSRADKASKMLKKFLARHLKASGPDKVKLAEGVNLYIRERGSAHPAKRVKVKASKDKEGIVLAELAQ